MGKLEALRQAQLWMLRQGQTLASVRRGMVLEEVQETPGQPGRIPPYYWAAFVLSGDWR